jgi:hypothetical protein
MKYPAAWLNCDYWIFQEESELAGCVSGYSGLTWCTGAVLEEG